MRRALVAALSLVLGPLTSTGAFVLDKMEWQLYELIGDLRADGYECRTPERSKVFAPNPDKYLFDCRLAAASKEHAVFMGTTGKLSHGGSGGSTPCDRAARAGVEGACSENVAMTTGHPMAAREAYTGSFLHCTAMMNPHHNVIGVGVYYGAKPYPTYWAQLHHHDSQADESCHPAAGQIPPPPVYTTRAPPAVAGSSLPPAGPLTLPPGYRLPPGVTLLPPDAMQAPGASAAVPAASPAAAQAATTPKPAALDVKDLAIAPHAPALALILCAFSLAVSS